MIRKENNKMKINVSEFYPGYTFNIVGASYIGEPRSNTIMYATRKLQGALNEIPNIQECLIYIEDGMSIPDGISNKNVIVTSSNPQLDFARSVNYLSEHKKNEEKGLKYILTDGGYYVSESAEIGKNASIAPGCCIGHGVTIGNNAVILSGSIIEHATIGNNFYCNENAVIGSDSFTMAVDEDGNKYRVASMGAVFIGDNVEVGANDNIARGSCGNTIIEDYVKLDALIHIGHDVHLYENVEITAGVTVAGFVQIKRGTYIGIGAAIRNRIDIGQNCIIGMGATVTKSVDPGLTVVGNPARKFEK